MARRRYDDYDDDYDDDDYGYRYPARGRGKSGIKLRNVILWITFVVVVVLTGFRFYAWRASRKPLARLQSAENLEQIALALHQHSCQQSFKLTVMDFGAG